jgi:hypothetical protein
VRWVVNEPRARRNPVAADIARRTAARQAGVVGLTLTEARVLIALFGLVTDFDRFADDNMTITQIACSMFGAASRDELKGSQRQAAARGLRGLTAKGVILASTPRPQGGRGARFRVEFSLPDTAETVLAQTKPRYGHDRSGSSTAQNGQRAGIATARSARRKRPGRPGHTDLHSDVYTEGTAPSQNTKNQIVVAAEPVHAAPELYSATSRVLRKFTCSATREIFEPVVEALLREGFTTEQLVAAASRCEEAGRRTPEALAAETRGTDTP